MNKCGIYKITSPSGKIYIGQSWNINKRRLRYQRIDCEVQTYLYNSIKKYGWNNHEFEIIHELPYDTTQLVLDSYEILYWQQYKDCGKEMLNIREPGRGGKLSKETKAKLSIANIGNKKGCSNKGKIHTEEWKEKMRVPKSEETKLKMSKFQKGRPKSEKMKQKLRKPKSIQARKKMSISQLGNKNCLGRIMSAETRKKISDAALKRAKEKKN